MEIQISGDPKEIVALVVGLRGRQETIESQLAEHLTVSLEKKGRIRNWILTNERNSRAKSSNCWKKKTAPCERLNTSCPK